LLARGLAEEQSEREAEPDFLEIPTLNDKHFATLTAYLEATADSSFYNKAFDIQTLLSLLAQYGKHPDCGIQIFLIPDGSFLTKSGYKTAGVGRRYNSAIKTTAWGLEISGIVLIICGYPFILSIDQLFLPEKVSPEPSEDASKDANQMPDMALQNPVSTIQDKDPAGLKSENAAQSPEPTVPQTKAFKRAQKRKENAQRNNKLVDQSLTQVRAQLDFIRPLTKTIVADAWYAQKPYIDGVCDMGMDIVGKMRKDAKLKFPFTGEQKKVGRPRKYDGDFKLSDANALARLTKLFLQEHNVTLYFGILWRPSLKRKILLVVVKLANGITYMLYSTDLEMDASTVFLLYRQRFQIEFCFRDMKQHLGLEHAQTTQQEKLDYHFNMAGCFYNLITAEHLDQKTVSFKSHKLRYHNYSLFIRVCKAIGVDPEPWKNTPEIQELINLGTIAA